MHHHPLTIFKNTVDARRSPAGLNDGVRVKGAGRHNAILRTPVTSSVDHDPVVPGSGLSAGTAKPAEIAEQPVADLLGV